MIDKVIDLLESDEIKYVPDNLKEEMFDMIISDIKSQIEWYSEPYEVCMQIIDHQNTDMISEIAEYLWTEYHWFVRKPKFCKRNYDIADFFYEFPHETTDDYEHIFVKLGGALDDLRQLKATDSVWIFTDTADDTRIMSNEDFFDYEIIGAIDDMNGIDNCKHHIINIIKIIKKY